MLGVIGSSLKMVKLEPTTSNMSQHIATRRQNAHNMLRPTMLRYVALACCDRFAGALYFKSRDASEPVAHEQKHSMIQRNRFNLNQQNPRYLQ